MQGNRPLFLQANGGREVLFTYWQAALGALLGVNVFSLRLASALAGIATIPATYVLLRLMLRRNSRAIAAFTTLVLAISFWHIHFSHYGIRVITTPLLYSGVFGLFWVGTRASRSASRMIAYALSGFLLGLSVWTHPTGRLAPFVLILYTLWLLIRLPRSRRFSSNSPLFGLLLSGFVAFLVFLPLGLEFYRHPDFFFDHASEVSIFAERVSGDSSLNILAHNLLKLLGMFSIQGDLDWTHNLAGRPVFDPAMSIPFYIGLVIGVVWWWRHRNERSDSDVDALVLLAIWAGIMLAPTLFSEAAPNYSRALPALPALFVPAGLGLTWIAGARKISVNLRHLPITFSPGAIIVAIIILLSASWTIYDYFVKFAGSRETYYVYDADKLDALDYLSALSENNSVYLSELWGGDHATVRLLRKRTGIKSFDGADMIVMPPPDRGAVYAFPHEQLPRAQALATLWPDAELEQVLDPYGRLLLNAVHVSPEQLANWPQENKPELTLDAHFSEAPTLIGVKKEAETGTIWLFWRAEETMLRDLTTFIHLLDADGKRVGQVDSVPGNGSFRTNAWSPGERVINRYHLEITDPCAGEEDLRMLVGWYEYLGGNRRMPRNDATGDTALVGSINLPSRSFSAGKARPELAINRPVAENLTLLGATIHGEDWQAGSPLTLDLYWQAGEHAPDFQTPLALTLAGADTTETVWNGALTANAHWKANEVLCRRLRFRLPTDASAGTYQLGVTAAGTVQEIDELVLTESTRLFEPPDITVPINSKLGGEIELLGLAKRPHWDKGGALSVTLLWKALSRPQDSYKVFVHLLDKNGQIVAQSDAIPVGAYPTNHWLPQEIVIDPHILIPAPGDLDSTGDYQLFAGMYNPNANGHRLQVFDSSGQPLDDARVFLATIPLP